MTPISTASASSLDEIRHRLNAFVAAHPDTLFEDKGAAVAVHYRANPALRDLVEAEVNEASESKALNKRCDHLAKCAADLRLALRSFPPKAEWERIQHAHAVQQPVSALQQSVEALEDDPASPRHLTTVRGKGYRLLAD